MSRWIRCGYADGQPVLVVGMLLGNALFGEPCAANGRILDADVEQDVAAALRLDFSGYADGNVGHVFCVVLKGGACHLSKMINDNQ